MDFVLHCRSFLEVILYNTKAVVHFLLPDFFSCVCVYNIVQYLVLGEEIIFNFDNLIFLVISIRGWAFVLVRGMSILREKKKSPQERFPQFSPAPPFHTAVVFLLFGSSSQKSCRIASLLEYCQQQYRIILELGHAEVLAKCTRRLWSQIGSTREGAQNTWSCCLGHPVGSGLGSPFLLVFHE